MAFQKAYEEIKKIILNPVLIAFYVFILSSIVIIFITLMAQFYDLDFFKNLLVEAHGMLLDILVIGVFILWLNQKGQKALEVKIYNNEIEDFRRWESTEAMLRIQGNIKRLNRMGVSKIDLSETYLIKVNLEGADLEGADLEGAKMTESNLYKVKLRGANLHSSNLQKANLEEANLVEAFLGEAHLEKGILLFANLEKAYLNGANLTGAELGETKLQYSNLVNAILKNANLSSADLTGANLSGADLEDIIVDKKTNFDQVKYSKETKFPNWLNETKREELGMILVN